MNTRQKILIVDDRKENLFALRSVLADLDAEVVEASNGNDALAATLHHNFALALLDVQMPEMDGYELAELLRGARRTRRLPIVFLTAAYGAKEQIFQGYEAGAVDYLVKPYDPQVLLSKVRFFLELHRANSVLAEKVAALAASEERYRSLVSTVPDIVYRIDQAGCFTFLNEAVRSLGYTPEELIGTHFSTIMRLSDVEAASRAGALPGYAGNATGPDAAPRLFDERRTGPRRTAGLEVRLLPNQGKSSLPGLVLPLSDDYITGEVSSSGLYSTPYGKEQVVFLGTVGIIRDVTERKRAEEAVRAQEELFRMIAENVEDFIAVLDLEGRRLYNSPSYTRFFGNRESLKGTDSFAEIHPDDVARVERAFRETVRSGHSHRLNFRFVLASGAVRYMESCGALIRNSQGQPLHVVVVSRDITERIENEEEIRNLAFYDTLTQLPNRRLLNDRLDQAMAASMRTGHYGALMLLDLDNFKPLNDRYGHMVGDLLLVEVARRITSCVREMDTVARFGGDEFVVVLSVLDADQDKSIVQSTLVAEKIRALLAEPYVLKFQQEGNSETMVEHHSSASIGVVLFIDHEANQGAIFNRADTAMYQAKGMGRNSIRFHDLKSAGTDRPALD